VPFELFVNGTSGEDMDTVVPEQIGLVVL
jgi:hypothetical protein